MFGFLFSWFICQWGTKISSKQPKYCLTLDFISLWFNRPGTINWQSHLELFSAPKKICDFSVDFSSQERITAHPGGRRHGEGRTAPEHRVRHRLWRGAKGTRPGARGQVPRGRLHLRHLPGQGLTFEAVKSVLLFFCKGNVGCLQRWIRTRWAWAVSVA